VKEDEAVLYIDKTQFITKFVTDIRTKCEIPWIKKLGEKDDKLSENDYTVFAHCTSPTFPEGGEGNTYMEFILISDNVLHTQTPWAERPKSPSR
jgi:hypothetical protein